MKMNSIPILAIATCSLIAGSTHAQFTINWSTIDGGGDTSSGGQFSINGTIGQPDANRMSGDNYTLAGGFWSVIQRDGLPPLNIKSRAGNLVLSWPGPADAPGVVVQSATQLATGGAGWENVGGTPVRVGEEFELVIGPALTPTNPVRFFRLHIR